MEIDTFLMGFVVAVFLFNQADVAAAAVGVGADEGEHGGPDEGEAREGGEKHCRVVGRGVAVNYAVSVTCSKRELQ